MDLPFKHIKVVIFDCDGVLFDSRQANINYYNHLLTKFGLPSMKEAQVEYIHMHTAEESVRFLFKDTPYLERAQQYRMNMDYMPFIKDMTPEPGAKELLAILKPRFFLAMATNRSNTISDVIKTHGLDDFFDMVVSCLDVRNPKPHPEPINKILRHFDLAPSQGMYVGDSAVDQETARAAGVVFVAYKNEKLEADYHVARLLDIARILGCLQID
ncbi:MAG: HAD family hydrolase [Deltaproteobacteria bacterium]|nr:MAG: HAD family hydrolase [Deltaproteobacteria bacterium]